MTYYTDYPVTTDSQGILAVELLAYDRNLHATVVYQGDTHVIKAGYLYQDAALTKRVTMAALYGLPRVPGGRRPTRREVAAELRGDWRKRTRYQIYLQDTPCQSVATLEKALARMYWAYQQGLTGHLLWSRQAGRNWHGRPLLRFEPEATGLAIYHLGRFNRRPRLKLHRTRHFTTGRQPGR